MSKELRIRITSFVLAAVLAFFGTVYSITVITFAANPSSWDDVGEDAIKLRDAYLEYFDKVGSGDFIGAVVTGVVDLPISWLKTMSDGALAISPVDDLYYYLKDGVLQFEDNREHRAGGGGGRRRGEATEIQPEVPASFVKQVNDYWSEHFKPHANSQQYIVSYQSEEMTDTSFSRLKRGAILYGGGNSWGNKQWDTVYVLPFVQDDFGGTYYCKDYFHFYATRDDDVKFNLDLVQIDSDKVTSSNSCLWADNTYFSIQWIKSNSGQIWVTGWKDFYSYNSATSVYATLPSMMNFRFVNADWNEVYPNQVYESSSFTPWNNKNDDIGFILSSEPFELVCNQNKIDYDKFPNNYTITIEGDNIYNYPITDPSTGKSTTINNYITNNYIIGDSGGSSGGDTTNNIWNIDFPDFIANITTSIETAFTNVFVADVDVINNYNVELQDTFNKKLPFVNDFGDIFKSLFVDIVDNNFVYAGDLKPSYSSPGTEKDETDSGGTAEASESSGGVRDEKIIYPKWSFNINFFGKEMELTILDFSLYAEPLSYVRLIACVFIYAVYFVNLMRYLPTLIGNVADMGRSVYTVVNPPKKNGKGDD